MIELPQWAESRHGGYNRPSNDMQELVSRVNEIVHPLVQWAQIVAEAFQQIAAGETEEGGFDNE